MEAWISNNGNNCVKTKTYETFWSFTSIEAFILHIFLSSFLTLKAYNYCKELILIHLNNWILEFRGNKKKFCIPICFYQPLTKTGFYLPDSKFLETYYFLKNIHLAWLFLAAYYNHLYCNCSLFIQKIYIYSILLITRFL